MTDIDKINSIITKCRLMRESTGITPREYMLSDLVEALAHELLAHERDHRSHVQFIGGPPPPQRLDPPFATTTPFGGKREGELEEEDVEAALRRFGFGPRRRGKHKDTA